MNYFSYICLIKNINMENYILALIFILALSGTIYFFGKLASWMVYKIAPENCKSEITNSQIRFYNGVMLISIFLWAIIFYSLISR